MGYLERIRSYCERFEIAPKRGVLRNDIRPGLRLVGFERRAVIAFTVEEDEVRIVRILYGGRDLESVF